MGSRKTAYGLGESHFSAHKNENAFCDKIVKKQPDLVTETAFDQKRRPGNALGTVTPK